MNLQKRDKLVKRILCYMKAQIDKAGIPLHCMSFDFSMSKIKRYFNAPDEVLSDGDDLIEFRKQCKITNEGLDEVMKYCNSMGYANSINLERVELKEEGRVLALSIEQAKLHKKFPDWLKQIIVGVIIFILGNVSMFFIMKGLK